MPRARLARIIAANGAAICLGALVLQFILIARVLAGMGYGLAAAAWIYFSYFTMIANLCAFAILACASLWPRRRAVWTNGRVLLCVASALVAGGLVYTLALRPVLHPHGLQNLADILLHYVTPALFGAWFLAQGATGLRRRHAWVALILPLAYLAYAMARAQLDGWYPYPFLDPRHLTWAGLAFNVAVLAASFWLCALTLIILSKRFDRAR
jgi:hypothetical protein